ncbi:hypothetical protein DPMN_036180 [Dreissena polymorpha]|uniref:Uncharacterized protein n=1 Tax=Dreissena polymorpha TaxID=45954 RepID=A0A9D4RNL2_DREPO|nr:hypothetical protein DPMN_036180 [Dreissena polymorpha]
MRPAKPRTSLRIRSVLSGATLSANEILHDFIEDRVALCQSVQIQEAHFCTTLLNYNGVDVHKPTCDMIAKQYYLLP